MKNQILAGAAGRSSSSRWRQQQTFNKIRLVTTSHLYRHNSASKTPSRNNILFSNTTRINNQAEPWHNGIDIGHIFKSRPSSTLAGIAHSKCTKTSACTSFAGNNSITQSAPFTLHRFEFCLSENSSIRHHLNATRGINTNANTADGNPTETTKPKKSLPTITTPIANDKGKDSKEEEELLLQSNPNLQEFMQVSRRAGEFTTLATNAISSLRSITKDSKKSRQDVMSLDFFLTEMERAEQSVDALLSLTCKPKFYLAISELSLRHDNNTTNATTVSSNPATTTAEASLFRNEMMRLHSSFLAVIQWSLLASALPFSSPPSSLSNPGSGGVKRNYPSPSFLLKKTINLSVRGEKIGFPPHKPLYNQLALAVGGSTLPPKAIFELSTSLQRIEFPNIISPDFFYPVLFSMASRGEYSKVLEVLDGMRKVHDNLCVTKKTRKELLNIIYGDDDDDGSNVAKWTSTSRVELISELKQLSNNSKPKEVKLNDSLLQGEGGAILQEELDSLNEMLTDTGLSDRSVDKISKALGKALTNLDNLEEDIDDNDEYDSDDSDFDPDELQEMLDEWEEDDEEELSSHKEQVRPIDVQFRDLSSLGETDSIPTLPAMSATSTAQDYDDEDSSSISSNPLSYLGSLERKLHKEQADAIIYIRDENNWFLPDITHQVMEWNDGNEMRYTREYEDALIQELLDEEKDEDIDDE